ncbi:MAG TPA: outer membrane beta-barrel protein [Longimicrobiales bacterium]|nr:outer membrane beta-barrel protein [Longimicrobiales bacterium]
MRRWLKTAVCVGCAMAAGMPAAAQVRSVTDELRLNIHASAVRLDDEDGGESVGFGGSLGYSASRWFMPFLTVTFADMNDGENDFRLRHLDAGVRSHVRGSNARLVPFVLVALTWRAATYEDRFFMGEVTDVKIAGNGISLGGGALYYLRPRVAVEVSGKWTGGEMDDITVDGLHFKADEHTISGSSMRLLLGVSLFPTGRTLEGER